MNRARELVLLALGSPAEPDPKAALEIVLEAIQAEAHTIAAEDATDARPLALACRLEALKAFVSTHMVVGWRDVKPTVATKPEAAE